MYGVVNNVMLVSTNSSIFHFFTFLKCITPFKFSWEKILGVQVVNIRHYKITHMCTT